MLARFSGSVIFFVWRWNENATSTHSPPAYFVLLQKYKKDLKFAFKNQKNNNRRMLIRMIEFTSTWNQDLCTPSGVKPLQRRNKMEMLINMKDISGMDFLKFTINRCRPIIHLHKCHHSRKKRTRLRSNIRFERLNSFLFLLSSGHSQLLPNRARQSRNSTLRHRQSRDGGRSGLRHVFGVSRGFHGRRLDGSRGRQ